ncbi:BQ2448_3555 [Microbotryum intermedium]|uniref:BQ2448_3555 protein n=1 Tax=Microbotryum intermedium TaxID=269621 RepID=A0A238FFL2_9BASI|nr:BQ2448_3555 [Microbotryum intermedium]
MHSHVAPGLDVLAQEELLVEDLKMAPSSVERPLDAINRVRRCSGFPIARAGVDRML